jgi:GAF domain-containing protein
MRCEAIWHVPSLEVAEFVAASRRQTFFLGQGLPGHVWANSFESVWIPDVTADSSFIRLSSVAQAGFRTVLSFPLHSDGKVVGTIGLFSREIQPYDPDLAAALADIVIQLRHFVERRRAGRSTQAPVRPIAAGTGRGTAQNRSRITR